MDQLPSPRHREMTSYEVALILVDRSRTVYLSPFMSNMCSLADAARTLGVSKSRMSYWLKKFLALGLIEPSGVEKRGKHRVPLYRSTADVFTVALERLPVDSDEAMLELHTRDFLEAEKRSVSYAAREHAENWFIHYSANRIDILPQQGTLEDAKMVNEFGQVQFSERQAANIRREMMALFERYASQTDPNGKPYLFKLLFVEVRPS